MCPCYRFLQEQSLYTATKDAITSFAAHFACRSSLLSHAVMVNLTLHTTILLCLCLGCVVLGFFGGEETGCVEGNSVVVYLFKGLSSK